MACQKNGRKICPRCEGRKRYVLGTRGRFRCAGCRYTFGPFTGRWLGQLRLSARQWLWVVKLFELEVSARKMAQQLAVSYPTALRASDLQARARSFKSMVDGAMPIEKAAALSGLLLPEDEN